MTDDEERRDALVADLDEAEVIDVIPDAMGDKVRVGRLRDAVLVGVQASPGILDTPELRDRFARAYAEACRRADGEAPATGQPAAPHSRCTWWSDPSDDLYGRCIKNVAHLGEGNSESERAHENAHGIQWHGQRWEPGL